MKKIIKLIIEKKVVQCIILFSIIIGVVIFTRFKKDFNSKNIVTESISTVTQEPIPVPTESATTSPVSTPTATPTSTPQPTITQEVKTASQNPRNYQLEEDTNMDDSINGNGKYKNIKVSKSDRKLLAQLVKREAGGESFKGQKAVVEVVLNRVLDSKYPDTIRGVIYQKGQFSTASKLSSTKPTQENYDAVDYVLEHGATVLNGNYIFFSAGKCGGVDRIKIGNQWFGKSE